MTKEFEGKKLLVLGATNLICDIVRHAQDMGAYVIALDYNEVAPAKLIADEAALINATDVDAIVKYCIDNKIDGVTTGFVDILLPVCYEVCNRLGLPYYATPKMISMSTNKIDFKETCKQYDVPVPETYLIGSHISDDIYKNIKYPVFVKPLDASGSRGARVCYNRQELDRQFEDALSFSKSNNAIIEEYVVGREFLLDYIAVDGEFRLLSMFDRYAASDRGSAINYANVSVAPAKSIDLYLDTVNNRVIKMFKDIGFTDGLIFLQGHTCADGIKFYEMGCRLGGSFFNLEQACLGFNPVDMIIRYALSGRMIDNIQSLPVDLAKYDKVVASCNYLLKSGDETIDKIIGFDVIKSLPSFVTMLQHQKVGTHYCKDRTVDKSVFSVYLAANDIEELKAHVNIMNEAVDVFNAKNESLLMNKFDPAEF